MKRILVVIALLVVNCGIACAQDIYSLIVNGKTEEASEALSAAFRQGLSDGNLLYYAALLEPDGDSSAALLKAALSAGPDERFRQDCSYRLAQYAALKQDYATVTELSDTYRKQWPNGSQSGEMLRLAALAQERLGQGDHAVELTDRYLKEHPTGELSQWGLVDKARLMISLGKPIGASRILSRLTQEAEGEGVAQALYLLALTALRSGKIDEATRQYALLFEECPMAVGLTDLEEQLGNEPEEQSNDVQAEKVTSTFYSVKVGVFASQANAQTQAVKFQSDKLSTQVISKVISGKTYFLVYVGKFNDYGSAAKLKASLQDQFGEQYEVVTR